MKASIKGKNPYEEGGEIVIILKPGSDAAFDNPTLSIVMKAAKTGDLIEIAIKDRAGNEKIHFWGDIAEVPAE